VRVLSLTGAPGEGGGGIAVGEEEQELHLSVAVRGGAKEALEVGVEVGERRVHLLNRHGAFFLPLASLARIAMSRLGNRTAADFLSLVYRGAVPCRACKLRES
jgi:hypothetical protein